MRSRSFQEGLGNFPTSNFAALARRRQRAKYGSVATLPMLATVVSLIPTTTERLKCQHTDKNKKRHNHNRL